MSLGIRKLGIPAVVWCAALTAFFGIIAATVPLINILAYMVWAVPAIILIRREGLKQGLAALAIAVIMMMVGLQNLQEGLFYGIQLYLTAAILGLLLKNHVSTNFSLVFILASAAVIGGILLIYSWSTGLLDIDDLRRYLMSSIDPYMEILKQNNALEAQQARGYSEAMVRDMLKKTVELSIQLIPATTIIGVLVSMVLNYLLAGKILTKRVPYQAPQLAFSQWQLPWHVIWVMIAGLSLFLLGASDSIWAVIGKNLILIGVIISITIGLAVAIYYFGRIPFSWFFKAILIMILVINLPITLAVLLVLGLFDPAVNFRRLGIVKKAE
ncbi:MAG: DUF2232 domain-containing protein [Thermincolia bacterium]